jgi:hypothetical protein
MVNSDISVFYLLACVFPGAVTVETLRAPPLLADKYGLILWSLTLPMSQSLVITPA